MWDIESVDAGQAEPDGRSEVGGLTEAVSANITP